MTAIADIDRVPEESVVDGSDGGGPLKRIFVPVDTFGRSAEAIALAARASSAVGGVVRLVHVRVFDPPMKGAGRFYPETNADARAVVEHAVLDAWACGSRASGQVVVAPRTQLAAAIAAAAQSWGAGVIVIARRPRRAFIRLLAGSVTDEVMRRASCPVLVVRPRSQ